MSDYIRLTFKLCLFSSLVLFALLTYGTFISREYLFYYSANTPTFHVFLCLIPVLLLYALKKTGTEKIEHWTREAAAPIKTWCENAAPIQIKMAIIFVAGLTLFQELIFIRWETALFPVFAIHKNFILLACFCGLGIGYAAAKKDLLLLPLSLPLLAFVCLFMILLRYYTGPDILTILQSASIQMQTPWTNFAIHEENFLDQFMTYLPVIILLLVVFALDVVLFVPLGQFCGYLMEKDTSPISSYGYNLVGSIGGVVALFVLSWFWTTPVIWFILCAGVTLWYLFPSETGRKKGLLSMMVLMVTIAWPVEPLVHKIYSPYQFIQISQIQGQTWFLASGSFRQNNVDLSLENPTRETINGRSVGYFELPYATAEPLEDVLIIGAGIGNDIAAVKKYNPGLVDAVEIDPAIPDIGRNSHPEYPIPDDRINLVHQDGRGYVRNTNKLYDAIVYGGQDTTILMSHGANVRFDTFLFTEEGIRDSYDHLKPGGVMFLSYVFTDDSLIAKKLVRILSNLPDVNGPVALAQLNSIDEDGHHVHLAVRKGEPLTFPPEMIEIGEFTDITDEYIVDDDVYMELPSDDWPFFLMDEKMFPTSYIISLCLVLVLSFYMVARILPTQRIQMSYMPFFFLGTGFMLVETKAITELGLVFGSTWHVTAITILGVLIMAFFANLWVSRQKKQYLTLPFFGILAMIVVGYLFAMHDLFPNVNMVTKIAAPLIMTAPIFFSGLVFSNLIKNCPNISSAMSYNIMGAMLGGVMEYNALRFGYSSLYIGAFVIYIIAWLLALSTKGKVGE